MDEIESLMKSPLFICIVDYERAIDRNRFGLNGREIGSKHGGVGMEMSKLDRPC